MSTINGPLVWVILTVAHLINSEKRVPRGRLGDMRTKTWAPSYGWLPKLWSLFGIPVLIRHLIFRVPRRGHNFDNHPYEICESAVDPGTAKTCPTQEGGQYPT